MGLRALFGKDPEADLDKGEKLLEREPVRALELAERAGKSDRHEIRARAEDLAARARARLLDNIYARADEAEGKGELEHAASWLEAALVHERDEPKREEVAARRERLLETADEQHNPFGEGRARRRLLGGDEDDEGPVEAAGDAADPADDDVEDRYETLVAMLAPEVAALYEDRPGAFRQAVVRLNDGDAAAALPLLEGLLAEDPDDPVLLLERGRARLLLGDAAGARGDLAAARPTFGDGPIDATDSLSLPLLEGEAALAAGDARAAADRLAELADPADGRIELCQVYATALVELGDEGAVAYAQDALAVFPRDPRLRLLLGEALARAGDLEGAIAVLERAAAPGAAGRGGRTARHLPSLRALAELYLQRGDSPDRAAELMAMVAHEQDGLLGAADHATLARYYRQVGDEESAAWSEAEAQRLTAAGGGELSAPPGALSPGRPRVL